jgi:hypothetical protein
MYSDECLDCGSRVFAEAPSYHDAIPTLREEMSSHKRLCNEDESECTIGPMPSYSQSSPEVVQLSLFLME